jgi:hypothetical protein
MQIRFEEKNDESIDVPDSLILRASEIALEEESYQAVGMLNGKWAIRAWEDAEADMLDYRVKIDASGVVDR